jgi:4-hydroxybenzoate polyprenyltransferase
MFKSGRKGKVAMKAGFWDIANRFLSLIRFSHTLFALPFALSAAALAWSRHGFSWIQLVGIVACLSLARAAAMAFNRLADEAFDAANPRTAGRHIPAGLLSRGAVRAFFAATSLGFIAATAVFLLEGNAVPLIMSLPTLAWICCYSYAKRFTALSHFWLGVALMLAPAAAWVVALGWGVLAEPWVPLLLGLAVFFWVAGFDIIYATQDADFDRASGLRSMPALLGVRGALWLARACHAATVVCLAPLPLVAPDMLGAIYWAGVAAVAALLIVEHALVRPDNLSRVNQAFFQVNAVISVGLLVIVLLDIGRHRFLP